MTHIQCVAQISFLHTEIGGKQIPFGNGFSPKLQFDGSPIEYFTELIIENDVIIYPGDQLKLVIAIKGEPGIYLHAGASFNLLQADYIIGLSLIHI